MNFIDIVYWGWYHILDKTIYWKGYEDGRIGPREHSYVVTFLLHGINIMTVFGYVAVEYFNKSVGLFPNLLLVGIIFIVGYLVYFKMKRANKIKTIIPTKIKVIGSNLRFGA